MDAVYCYDPFSFMPMLYFEALGLCGDGEGAAFVRNGRIAPGGELFWNTHGGLHSYCHSGVGGGAFHLIEAVRQLRHEAGPRQSPNAQTAINVGEGANYGTFPVTILRRGQA
jgi:acetyl-CoA acetyltransferase